MIVTGSPSPAHLIFQGIKFYKYLPYIPNLPTLAEVFLDTGAPPLPVTKQLFSSPLQLCGRPSRMFPKLDLPVPG